MNIREKLGLKPKATPQFGQSRSHAMNASKKMFKPNIQNKTVIIDGKKYKVKLTTREIRTLDKKGINSKGNFLVAQYNSPWVLPPFRKNEIIVRIN